jgi:two-component system LytT family response regulator
MVRVLIIEDEMIQGNHIENMLNKYDAEDIIVENQLETILDTVTWFQNNDCPDLIFMDVHLADGLCFEIFNEIHVNCPVIYTTGYDDYVFKAFKTKGLAYLVKPITEMDFFHALNKYLELYT